MFQNQRLKGKSGGWEDDEPRLKTIIVALLFFILFLFSLPPISPRETQIKWSKTGFFFAAEEMETPITLAEAQTDFCAVIISPLTTPPTTPSFPSVFFILFFRHDSFCYLGTNVVMQGICCWQRPAAAFRASGSPARCCSVPAGPIRAGAARRTCHVSGTLHYKNNKKWKNIHGMINMFSKNSNV